MSIETIQAIQANEVYQQILEDSYGGVMYFNKPSDYDTTELKALMTTPDSYDGIMKGVFHFINDQ